MPGAIFLESVQRPSKPFFEGQIKVLLDTVEDRRPRLYRTQAKIIRARLDAAEVLTQGLYEVFCAELHGVPSGRACIAELLVPRNPAAYTKAPLKAFSHTVIVELLDTMNELGWIEQKIGHYVQDELYRTAIRPTGKLLDVFQQQGYRWKPRGADKTKKLIVLRNYDQRTKKKYPIEFSDTTATRLMRKNLRRINQALRDSLICLNCDNYMLYEIKKKMAQRGHRRTFIAEDHRQGGLALRFDQVELYRIFSRSSFDLGGRMYGGWWQQVPSEVRRYITINGEETVEVDFSTFHPRLLFLEAGMEPPDFDIYTQGFDWPEGKKKECRGVVKRAFNAWINADSRGFKLTRKEEKLIGMSTQQLLKLFLSFYPALKEYFGTALGLSFQAKDAQACELILLRLLDQGIVALPIHDSFVVAARHQEQLIEAMRWAFTTVFGGKAALSEVELPLTDFETVSYPSGAPNFDYQRRTHEASVCHRYAAGYYEHLGSFTGKKPRGGGECTQGY